MTALQENFLLSNGVQLPKVGFGTWQIDEAQQAYDATSMALASGYRHIDTARVYGNEEIVGRAIRDSGIPRSDLFVATKLPVEIKGRYSASLRRQRSQIMSRRPTSLM